MQSIHIQFSSFWLWQWYLGWSVYIIVCRMDSALQLILKVQHTSNRNRNTCFLSPLGTRWTCVWFDSIWFVLSDLFGLDIVLLYTIATLLFFRDKTFHVIFHWPVILFKFRQVFFTSLRTVLSLPGGRVWGEWWFPDQLLIKNMTCRSSKIPE